MKVNVNLRFLTLLIVSLASYGCSPTSLPENQLASIEDVQQIETSEISNHLIFKANLESHQSLQQIAKQHKAINSRLLCSTNTDYQISGVAGDFDQEKRLEQNFSNPVYLQICLKDDINTCVKNSEELSLVPMISTCHLVLVTGIFGTQPRITHDFEISRNIF